MSRSNSHFPVSYICGGQSTARWKRDYNRELRRVVRCRLAQHWSDDDLVLPTIDEIANPWSGPRDGSGHYWPYDPAGRFDKTTWYRWSIMK